MSGVLDVAVFGSCITRDNFNSRFNPGYKSTYRCELLQNQMSVLSLMSDPLAGPWKPTREMSDYDFRNVRTEFDKSFLTDLAAAQPDYLVLDFFGDAHFGCLLLDDGGRLTDNRWKVHHTDVYEQIREKGAFERIHPVTHPDQYFALWSEAIQRFAAHVRATTPRTRVVVHHGHHTNLLTLPDRPRPVVLQKHRNNAPIDVLAANAQWRRMDAHATEVFGARSIDLTGEDFPTFDDHPWGPFYVHYRMDYYHRFLAELHKIAIEDGAAASPQMVAEIELAARETPTLVAAAAVDELARTKERLASRKVEVERLRGRVAALERTPVRRALSRLRRVARFRSAGS